MAADEFGEGQEVGTDMSEPSSASTETAVADAPTPAPLPDSNRGLKRLAIVLAVVAVVVLAAFAVVYYLGQRVAPAPSQTDRAVASAEAYVRDNPNDVGGRLGLASAYGSSNRMDDALVQYQEVLKAQPENRPALLGAGTILSQQNDLTGAKAMFQNMIDASGGGEFAGADPQLEEALYRLGAIDLQLGDLPGAISNLEAAVQIDSSDADAWNTLGDAHLRNGAPDKAAASYTKALTFVPTGWCEPYNGLAQAYADLKKDDGVTYAKAMADICGGKEDAGRSALQGISTGDFHIPALLGLAIAAEASGNTKEATDFYNQVIAAESTNITALSGLARLGANPTTAPSAHPSRSAS